MKIKELTIQAFNLYVQNSPLKNYMQSEEYARFMGENGYTYDYIGLVDSNDTIVAASLILLKKLSYNTWYGYAPKGFLINYYDETLLKTFVTKIKEFYDKKNVIFIKINPEIVVGELDKETYRFDYNPNNALKNILPKFGFKKLKDNMYFESREPRFNAYIDLKNAKLDNYSKVNRNKIRNSKRKGLYLEKGTQEDLGAFYDILETSNTLNYYKGFYNLFKNSDKVDLLLVRVNFERFIIDSQELYEEEQNKNNLLNEILHRSHKKEDLNRKMANDSKLCSIKNDIVFATEGLRENNNCIIAGALVVKQDNRVHIIESCFNRKYSRLNANYFLYNEIIEYYKDDYDYLDLNGFTGDFSSDNPYRGLNRFKLGFNPHIYEYIGEFDLIIKKNMYNYLLSSGKLAEELNKKEA